MDATRYASRAAGTSSSRRKMTWRIAVLALAYGGANVLRDLRARVAIRRVELALEVLRLRDVAARVLPVERGQRQRDSGREERRPGGRVVARRRTMRSGSQNSFVRLVVADWPSCCCWIAELRPIRERDLFDRRGVGQRGRHVERVGRSDRRADDSSERAIERRLRVGEVAFVGDEIVVATAPTADLRLNDVELGDRSGLEARLRPLQKILRERPRVAQVLPVRAARRAASRTSPTPRARPSAAGAASSTAVADVGSADPVVEPEFVREGNGEAERDGARRRAAERERTRCLIERRGELRIGNRDGRDAPRARLRASARGRSRAARCRSALRRWPAGATGVACRSIDLDLPAWHRLVRCIAEPWHWRTRPAHTLQIKGACCPGLWI